MSILQGPFTLAQAREAGLTWKQLQRSGWTRMSRGQYAASRIASEIEVTLRAVAQRMPGGYAFSGLTAAWVLGLDVAPCAPVEVTISRDVPVRARAGFRVRRASLSDTEVVVRRGFRITSPLRTVCDLGGRADLIESVVAIDMALRARLVQISEVEAWVDRSAGVKCVGRLRRGIRIADPRAESPMETRLRILLIKARLPMPDIQVSLHDKSGKFLGRADLYYPDRRLVIEFDGENHRDRMVSDVRRQNALVNAGYHVLRFTSADIRAPGSVAAEVRLARARLALSPDYRQRRDSKRVVSPD